MTLFHLKPLLLVVQIIFEKITRFLKPQIKIKSRLMNDFLAHFLLIDQYDLSTPNVIILNLSYPEEQIIN